MCWKARQLGSCCHQIGLAHSASKRQIRLLVSLNIDLQHIQVLSLNTIVHLENGCLRGQMVVTPESCRQHAVDAVDAHCLHLVTSRTLHRGDVESQNMAMLPGTLYVDLTNVSISLLFGCNMSQLTVHATLVTSDGGTIRRMTGLTDLFVTRARDGRDTLGRLDSPGVAELDFRCPYSAGDVHPVVVCCAFQWLPRVCRAIELLLTFLVLFSSFARLLDFELLPLAILVGHLLLVMRELGLLNELVFRVLDRTQHAFVLLVSVSSFFHVLFMIGVS